MNKMAYIKTTLVILTTISQLHTAIHCTAQTPNNNDDFNKFLRSSAMPQDEISTEEYLDTGIVCSLCKSTSKLSWFILNGLIPVIIPILKLGCWLKIHDTAACSQTIDLFAPHVIANIKYKLDDPDYMCGIVWKTCPTTKKFEDFEEYLRETMEGQPIPVEPKPTGKSSYKILQLNDVHIDFDYREGYSIMCSSIVNCCEERSGSPKNDADRSGRWGAIDGTCDLPTRTFEAAINYIRDVIKPDYIFWLGDNTDHKVWLANHERQNSFTGYMTEYMREAIPDIPIFPILGNHEMLPVDIYDFDNPATDWVLTDSAKMFESFLPKDALDSFRVNGYYSTPLDPTGKRKARVIGLFVAAIDGINVYLWEQKPDPYGMIAWLKKTLQECEKNGEDVFILKHIPIGYLQMKSANLHITPILDRFGNIIRGVFAGHTHYDELGFIRGADHRFIAPQFIGPSLTTSSGGYPSFRVYEIDGDTNVVTDYIEYRLDLPKYNSDQFININAEWNIGYKFKEEYGLPDLSFASWESLYKLFKAKDETVLVKYHDNYYTGQGSKHSMNDTVVTGYVCNFEVLDDDWHNCVGPHYVNHLNIEWQLEYYVGMTFKHWIIDTKEVSGVSSSKN